MRERAALAIMAKRPRAGEVKTRLCPPLTPDEAARLACCFLLDTLEQVRRFPGMARYIAFSPPDAEAYFRAAGGEAFSVLPQRGIDLGERLANLSTELLGADFPCVIIRGADSPTLPDAILREAHEVLTRDAADVVVGPAHDGGYYLIGLRRPRPLLFQGIAWGTGTVLSQTVARADMAGLRTHLLPAWYDVDVESDLDRLIRDVADARTRAVMTREYLLGLAPFADRDRIPG